MSEDRYRRCLAAGTALYLAVLVLWALLLPAFRAPDEPHHYNSVLRLATGGGWPEPGTARLSDATLLATREAGFSHPDHPLQLLTSSLLPGGRLRGFGQEFVELDAVPRDERSVLDHTAELQDDVPATIDQMTQHPPLFYAVGALVVRALGAVDWRWDDQLLLLRLLCCALAAPVLPLVAGTARRLAGSRTTGLLAGAGLLAIPQLAHVASAVSNDGLTVLLGVAVTYASARALAEGPAPRRAVTAGALLGLGLLTKGFLLAAIPMVALAFLLSRAGSAPLGARARAAGLAGLVAAAVGGWWWVRNVLVHGALQPGGMTRPATDWGEDAPDLLLFVTESVDRLNTSFWGSFGWLEMPLPAGLTVPLGVALTGLVVASLAQRGGPRREILVLLTFPAGTVAVVLYGALRAYLRTGDFPGLQGRYLFSALAAILAAAAVGTARSARRAPRLHRGLPAFTLTAGLGFTGVAAAGVLTAVYRAPGEGLAGAIDRWAAWSPVPGPVLAAAALAPLVLGAVAILAFAGAGQWRPRAR